MDRYGGGNCAGLKNYMQREREKKLILDALPVLTLIAHSV